MTAPRLGQLATLSLDNMPVQASDALLMFSGPVSTFLPLGFGCEFWLDPLTVTPLTTIPANLDLTFFIDADTSLAGSDFQVQAIALHNPAPYGYVLTNGLYVHIGF